MFVPRSPKGIPKRPGVELGPQLQSCHDAQYTWRLKLSPRFFGQGGARDSPINAEFNCLCLVWIGVLLWANSMVSLKVSLKPVIYHRSRQIII